MNYDSLEITTKVGCANNCGCCPQKTLLSSYKGPKDLNILAFGAILSHVPTSVRIDFSGFCDPFANSDAIEMMRTVNSQNRRFVVYATLSMITLSDIEELQWMKNLIRLTVHCPDTNFYKVPSFAPIIQKAHYIKSLLPETEFTILGPVPDELKPHELFASLTPPPILSRGRDLAKRESNISRPSFCGMSEHYTHNVVLPNGDVYLCCMDYSLEHRLGNLLETHYDDLDRNTEYGFNLCKGCEWAVLN